MLTAGGTREPIDGVRVIANSSTGKTGALLADALFQAGWETTLLRAQGAIQPTQPVTQKTFVTVEDLDHACQELLANATYELVIHAAAVSDFVVDAVVVDGVRYPAPVTVKLPSDKPLSVELMPSKKILPELKGYSCNPNLHLVGFKLTNGASEAEIAQAVGKVLLAGADLVVHNDLQTIHTVRATLWDATGQRERAVDEAALVVALLGYARSLC